MSIELYPIIGRRPRFAGSLASLNDFIYANGDAAAGNQLHESAKHSCTSVTTLTPQEFLDNPHYSLYCFEPNQARVIFVALPPQLDLTAVPFTHQAQYEEALHLVTVPYALFNQLAEHLPVPAHPIFLYMSARSGSTLLSHALNASGAVSSLSEPDAVTQFVHLRAAHADNGCTNNAPSLGKNELVTLANSTMRYLFRAPATHMGGQLRIAQAVKFRSEGIQVMDLFQQAFPKATNIFLYRDALGWVNSFHRIFTKLNLAQSRTVDEWQQMYEGFLQCDLSYLRRYLAPTATHLSLAEQLTLWWIAVMEWYLAQWQAGTPVLAVRYNDLNRERELTLEAIFGWCALPATAVQSALAAFDQDAQAGTDLARDEATKGATLTLDAQAVGEITAILQRHPQLRHPNYWAPGTLDLNFYRNSRRQLHTADEARMAMIQPL